MEENDQAVAISRRVRELLESGFYQLPPGISAEPGAPLPVRAPDGAIHSWIVPFTAENQIVAWAQLLPTLESLRFSVFGEQKPEAAEWLDPAAILYRVADVVGLGQHLSEPVLTYDRDPSRLVWMVESRPPLRRWFTAGGIVWEAPKWDPEITG
ncbi:MAG TPA: hypothetical protein VG456_24345 [Candidatus Sulfopaludibacter sp.]|nr:hypothetical protein [Candidatus Sulfopaludibacter sp.]